MLPWRLAQPGIQLTSLSGSQECQQQYPERSLWASRSFKGRVRENNLFTVVHLPTKLSPDTPAVSETGQCELVSPTHPSTSRCISTYEVSQDMGSSRDHQQSILPSGKKGRPELERLPPEFQFPAPISGSQLPVTPGAGTQEKIHGP